MIQKFAFLKQDAWAVALLGAMAIWFGHGMIFSNQIPIFRDLGPYFYPMRFSLAESFQRGELPLWDPHTGMGFPLLADFQSSAFYPPHLLFLVFPFLTAIKAVFVFHFLVAILGSYALLRHWEFPPYLAIVGSALFSLGGTLVSLGNLLNHFQAAVWLPWALFFAERHLLRPSWNKFLIFSLVLLVQLLAGSPELYALSLGLLLLNAVRICAVTDGVSYGRAFGLLLAANALVLALALVQILPTVELFLQSRGHMPIGYGENILWSFHPLSLLNLFFLDKEIDPNLFSGVQLFFIQEIPFFVSHYMGVLALVGITFWFFFASLKEKLLILTLAAVSLVLAMGVHTPVYPFLFKQMPFLFGLFRFPEKFFFFVQALLLWMALKGLFQFLRPEAQASKGPVLALLGVSVFVLALYLFCRFEVASLIRFITWATGGPSPSALRSSSGVLFYIERQMALLFVVALLLYLSGRKKIRHSIFKSLLVGLAFFDLASAHQPYLFLLKPDFIWQGPRVVAGPAPEPSRLFYYPGSSNIHPSYYAMSKPVSFAEFQSLLFGNLFPNMGVFHKFDYMQELDALMRWPYRLFLGVARELPPEKLYRLLGALNVEYITSLQPMPEGAITLVRHFPDYPSWLYRLKRRVPRAYIASKAMEEKNPVNVLRRLSSEGFDPLKEVMLEEPLSLPAQNGFRGQAEIIRYGNQQVTIRASLNGAGVLVLADSFYPGWRVYINGKEGTISRANLFFRAVLLPPGDHEVEFHYRPRMFTLGLVLTLVTFLGVAGFTASRYLAARH